MDSYGQPPRNPAVDPATGQRIATRDSLLLSANFWVGSAEQPVCVRVRNLSAGGLMAEYGEAVDIGTAVSIDLRGIGRVAGRIAWVAEGRCGVALDEPIDPLRARKPIGTNRPANKNWRPR